MTTSASLDRFVAERWDQSIIPALCDYVRIPNKSPAFDSHWEANGHMAEAVRLLERIGEADYRITEGANEQVQLEALLASLAMND